MSVIEQVSVTQGCPLGGVPLYTRSNVLHTELHSYLTNCLECRMSQVQVPPKVHVGHFPLKMTVLRDLHCVVLYCFGSLIISCMNVHAIPVQ